MPPSMMSLRIVVSFLAYVAMQSQGGAAFHIPLPKSLPSRIVMRSTEDAGDFGGGLIGDDGASFEGSELASQFYDQVQKRKQGLAKEPSPYDNTDVSKFGPVRIPKEEEGQDDDDSKPKIPFRSSNQPRVPEQRLTNEDLRKLVERTSSSEPFSRKNVSGKSKKKYFTGGPEEEAPSAGFFTGQSGSVFSTPEGEDMNTNPRARMAKNEMDLVTRSEQAIGVQALLALVLLGFYLFVGLTGGITDGSEREILTAPDTSMEGMEQLLPQPTDTETSVWL